MLMNMLKIIENVNQWKWTMKVLAETHDGVFLVLISEMGPFLLQIWFDKNDHEASSGTGIKRFTDPKYMILKSSPYVNSLCELLLQDIILKDIQNPMNEKHAVLASYLLSKLTAESYVYTQRNST